VLTYYKASRKSGEGFGDFCERAGLDALRRFAAAWLALPACSSCSVVGSLCG
jgi:hypothetical protein